MKRIEVTLTAAGGVGLLVAVLLQLPRTWWAVLGNGLLSHWPVVTLAVASSAGLTVGAVLRHRQRRNEVMSAAPVPPDRPVRPLQSWTVPAGAVLIAGITWGAVWWLQNSVPNVGDVVQRSQLRVETIRTGLSIGAGAGAALALLLALRRQQLAERTQLATEYDAGEKRVTELYVKAADQLGSEKAPVRLAGLYALERLAQDNPVHRQSIVEVICAYLRMPYTPYDQPTPTGQDEPDNPGPETTTTTENETGKPDPREERQVRLAAQRILARHLKPTTPDDKTNPAYWGRMVLDLTEATLIDLDLTGCHLHQTKLTNATFAGEAWFDGATFSGDAWFDGASFSGTARFGGASFFGDAVFGGTAFFSDAVFEGASFFGEAWFGGASFSGTARFGEAMFFGDAWFGRASFSGTARFGGASFSGTARFGGASFSGTARFGGASFSGDAWFGRASFSGDAWFDGASFSGDANFDKATVGASDQPGHVWPDGWQVDEATRKLVREPEDVRDDANQQ